MKQVIHVTSKWSLGGILAFWWSTLTPLSSTSTHWTASLIGVSLTFWLPPGSSGYYLECSAWCLCDPTVSLWPLQYFPSFWCVFHFSNILGGPYVLTNRTTNNHRPQLWILRRKLCFWASVSTVGVSCAGIGAPCLSCVSEPHLGIPHGATPLLRDKMFGSTKPAGPAQDCKQYINVVMKMWVPTICQLPK